MEFKQSKQKYAENISATEKRLLPAILAATPNNGQLIAGWLIKNCAEAEGEIIDASVENIIRAVKALDVAGLIDWQTPPKVAPAKKRHDFLQTNDGAKQNQPKDAEFNIQMAQERKRREALGDRANAELMSEAARIVRNHSSTSHSRTARERDVLRKEFDRLVAAKVHPKDLLTALKAKQDTFANGDVTRPRF
jgi:hypothetical protein